MTVDLSRRVLIASLVLLFASGQRALAVVLDVNQYDGYIEYLGLTGVAADRNAPFRMLVPDNWNGQLIVYSRGTGSAIKLNESGVPQFDDPSGLPILGVTPLINVPGKPPGDNSANDQLEAYWLGLEDSMHPEPGFALVASDYKPDPRFTVEGKLGWVVEDGIQDTLAVTRQARRILSKYKEQPLDRTLLIGRSQGSVVALKINETKPSLYNGVITGCTVGAGTPGVWDNGLGVALAFDATFGWECNAATEEECMQDDGNGGRTKIDWGSPEGGDIPVDLSFQEGVLPTLINHVSDPANFALFEFIRLVNGLPLAGFYPTDPTNPPAVFPEGGLEFNWLFGDMLFLTEVRADLEDKANGRVAQNEGHEYTLSKDEIKYLKRLGLDKDTIKGMLDEMNDNDVKAKPWAREYAEENAAFTGKLRRPVISMHTWSDGLVIPENESALADTVAEAGKSRKLLQVFTPGFGHCSFTPQQWIADVDAMNLWLDEGMRPDSLDFELFPPALPPLVPPVGSEWSFPLSAEGFINFFEPGPWPQPLSE